MKYAVAFVALLWALTLATSALASTRIDALKVGWYLKGEGDAVLPSMGLLIVDQKCSPTKTKWVVCTNRVTTQDNSQVLCSKGRFVLSGFAVTGQWSRPKPCAPSS